MLVKNIMKKNPVLCRLDASVQEVVKLMMENESDFVTVVESYTHKNPIGIITEHEICKRTIAKGINPLKLSAGKVMSSKFEKVSAVADIAECRQLLSDNKNDFLIVVNENNACCGFITNDVLPPTDDYREFPSVISERNGFQTSISYADRIF